ncbi:helix-turn-helix transcriptional regulator [Eggerthella guodeyinii]|nr:helix-turn-helix transcriptional regulator [Eggerthella guodeyinii]
MLPEGMLTGIVVAATAVLFVACCMQIARASFLERASRADVRLAVFWVLAFAASVIGCLAFTEAYGNEVAALYASALCVAALAAGRLLLRSWRAGEAAELARMAELRALVDRYREGEDSVEARCARAARTFDLTRREEEVLALLLEGRTRSEIARELYVSGDTVKTHIRNLYRKTGVAGKDELVEAMGVQG